MKKYLLGSIAFVMAIGLSAFRANSNEDKKIPASFTDYYWFETKTGEGSEVILRLFDRLRAQYTRHGVKRKITGLHHRHHEHDL